MTNWNTYIIVEDKTKAYNLERKNFCLDGYVGFKYGSSLREITLVNRYPFSTYEEGDQIEIDLDYTNRYASNHHFDSTSAIRKVGWVYRIYSKEKIEFLQNKIKELEKKVSSLESNNNHSNNLRYNAESNLNTIRTERDNLQVEKNNLERDRDEWKAKFRNENSKYEDYKKKWQ